MPAALETKSNFLDVIDYERLKARDKQEITKLVQASSSPGIFFLDLRGPATRPHLDRLPAIVQAQRDLFAQPPDANVRGYDCFSDVAVQRLKIKRTEHMRDDFVLPGKLSGVRDSLEDVAATNDAILRKLSMLLCDSLNISASQAAVIDPNKPGLSNTCLGLAAASVGARLMDSHIDEDMLTITYYDEPFLEMWDCGLGDWRIVEVFEGLPLVNVGQEFEIVSDKRLHAPYHRVVQPEREINLIMYDLNAGIV